MNEHSTMLAYALLPATAITHDGKCWCGRMIRYDCRKALSLSCPACSRMHLINRKTPRFPDRATALPKVSGRAHDAGPYRTRPLGVRSPDVWVPQVRTHPQGAGTGSVPICQYRLEPKRIKSTLVRTPQLGAAILPSASRPGGSVVNRRARLRATTFADPPPRSDRTAARRRLRVCSSI